MKDLDRVQRVVKLTCFVNAVDDAVLPRVADGASRLLLDAFGQDRGSHARSAVGTRLPFGVPLELEAVFEIGDGGDACVDGAGRRGAHAT